MRLVDGEQRSGRPVRVQRLQLGHEAGGVEALGRDVEQRDLAARHLALDLGRLLRRQARIEVGRADAGSSSAPTWSCISAISGERRWSRPLPTRWRRMAGTW